MNKPSIIRFRYDNKETCGNLFITDENGVTLFTGFTLELPYKDNQHRISSIPAGLYPYKKVLASDKIPYEHLALTVPNRDGICVHAGNYNTDTLGCILVGDKMIDINADGEDDIIDSRATLIKILSLLPENGMIQISEK